jgi:hypothetical protein
MEEKSSFCGGGVFNLFGGDILDGAINNFLQVQSCVNFHGAIGRGEKQGGHC